MLYRLDRKILPQVYGCTELWRISAKAPSSQHEMADLRPNQGVGLRKKRVML